MSPKNKRLEREQKTVTQMIGIYCKDQHNGGKSNSVKLCSDCQKLLEYAVTRINGCRYANCKPVCSKCRVHCYKIELRQKIKKVMQHAGPKMIFRHPLLTARHFMDGFKNP